MTVHPDILNGTRGRKTAEGWELERVMLVDGVTGDGNAKVINAVNEIDIPIGAAHPALNYAYLRSIVPERVDGDKVQLRYIYNTINRNPDNPDGEQTNITYDSSVTQIQTEYDIYGNRIDLTYDYSIESDAFKEAMFGSVEAAPTAAFSKCEPISIPTPQHTANFVKRLAYNPASLGEVYDGTVNIAQWYTYPARTLLCTNIRGVSTDDGRTFVTTFNFQYNPDTWDQYQTWTFPDGSKPTAAQLTAQIANGNSNATGIFRGIPERDFGGLPL